MFSVIPDRSAARGPIRNLEVIGKKMRIEIPGSLALRARRNDEQNNGQSSITLPAAG
jgi:hypothetical protein